MPTNAESLTAVFDSRDLERLVALLDDRVIWRGLVDEQHRHDEEHLDDEEHEQGPPMCTDRDQVGAVLEGFLASGATGYPVAIAEVGDTVVVDPRPEPAQSPRGP